MIYFFLTLKPCHFLPKRLSYVFSLFGEVLSHTQNLHLDPCLKALQSKLIHLIAQGTKGSPWFKIVCTTVKGVMC